MNRTDFGSFKSLTDALKYVGLTSGLQINQTLYLPASYSLWSTILNILPLLLGSIGLLFNILALIVFSTSKTFVKSSFRYYIYAFVLVNCASILTHSWLYLLFYVTDAIRLCKYTPYLQQSLSTTSLWIMVLLSLERSLTFTRPFTVKRLLQSRAIGVILIVLTALCFVLHIDEFLSADVKAFRWVNFAYGICSIKRGLRVSEDRIRIVRHAHSFILPFLFNSMLDIYICFKICQRRQRLAMKSRTVLVNVKPKKKHRRSRKSLAHEITLTLLCQSLWLLFTYFPNHLFYFLISFKLINDHDRDNSSFNFFLRQNLLFYLAFSPTLYVIFSPTLRKEIHSYIRRTYKRYKANRMSNMSDTQNKFRHVFSRHHPPPRPMNLTILITTDERCPRRAVVAPVKVQHFSSSTPCLFKDPCDSSHEKLERSHSLHD